MPQFELDTSGQVCIDLGPNALDVAISFGDLDAFTQGYIEALFDTSGDDLRTAKRVAANEGAEPEDESDASREAFRALYGVGFSDLAPEALAAIMADCAGRPDNDRLICTPTRQHDNGARFWRRRERGAEPGFPPLAPYLGDDGKVRL